MVVKPSLETFSLQGNFRRRPSKGSFPALKTWIWSPVGSFRPGKTAFFIFPFRDETLPGTHPFFNFPCPPHFVSEGSRLQHGVWPHNFFPRFLAPSGFTAAPFFSACVFKTPGNCVWGPTSGYFNPRSLTTTELVAAFSLIFPV